MADTTRAGFVIVGGGIGGMATALALSQHGIASTVLEQAPEFGEIGAGLQLAPNALRVLDVLGVLDSVYADAVYPPQAVLMDAVTGEKITALDFGEAFRDRYGYPYIVTHRRDLHESLVAAVVASGMAELITSATVTEIRQEPFGDHLELSTAEGRSYLADAVVGADGLHSVVRQHTLDDGPPSCSDDVAYRGTVPFDQVSHHEGKDNMMWWVGPGMHLVQYPVRRRQLYNQVAVFTSRTYRPDSDEWGLPDELDAAFAGKHPLVQQAVGLINRDRRWALYDRAGATGWTKGAVTLLGDAAHPMLQYLAQGACQALEDAVVVADRVAANPGDPGAAFRSYEQERGPRTALAQAWARNVGEIIHGDGVLALLRDALLKPRKDDDFTYFDWLYAYSGRR